MATHTFVLQRSQFLEQPIEQVFEFFGDARNLEAITPKWLGFKILTPGSIDMHVGTRIDYRLNWRFVRLRWTTEILAWEPPFRFIDSQLRGPYALWHHAHTFQPESGGTRMVDIVRYALPLGLLGVLAHRALVARDLKFIFDFREQRVRELLQAPKS